MKASTLIGLPLVLLLGSFGPTWHLVGTSNLLLTCYSMLNWLFLSELVLCDTHDTSTEIVMTYRLLCRQVHTVQLYNVQYRRSLIFLHHGS